LQKKVLPNILKNITTKGIKPGMNASDEKRVTITNYILLMAAFVAFGRIFMFYYTHYYDYSIVSVIATIFFLSAYFLNTKGYFNLAKFFLLIVGNGATFFKEFSSGGQGNQIYLMIASFMVVFLLFSYKEKAKLTLGLMISVINFTISVFLIGFLTQPIKLEPVMFQIEKIFGAVSSAIIIIFVTWYFVKKSNNTETTLIKSNELLKSLYDKICLQKEKIEELLVKSNRLLLNVLPEQIATRLKEGESLIADKFDEAAIMFVDIVEFTKLSKNSPPEKIVKELNKIFTVFDKIALKYNIEKIKTIGDCYMAAAGIPEPRTDHSEALSYMALEILNEMQDYKTDEGHNISFRIGLDCGPIVAGVIGRQKFSYDLWGDTVNTASRMEKFGEPGRIHITDRFKAKLTTQNSILNKSMNDVERKEGWSFIERGEIEIKGKGKMKTWFLVGK